MNSREADLLSVEHLIDSRFDRGIQHLPSKSPLSSAHQEQAMAFQQIRTSCGELQRLVAAVHPSSLNILCLIGNSISHPLAYRNGQGLVL